MKHLLATLLLIGSFALVGCGGSDGPGDTVEALAYAMEDGDSETVKEIIPGLAGMLGDEKLKAMVTEASAETKEKGGITSVEILEETIDGDTATVKSKITFGNGDTEEETQKLTKVDGKWIMSMDAAGKGPGGGGSINLSDDEDAEFPDDFEVPVGRRGVEGRENARDHLIEPDE
ncbi:MAG: DUF4878 domain-containing protein, partial [Phycisphaeraceae bacterium]